VDAGYGSSGPFRQALSARGLAWAIGLSRRQNVYPADVGLVFPEARRSRRRKYHLPDRSAVSAEQILDHGKWRKVSWRRGTKGRLSCQFAATRVHIADGHRHRMADGRVQAMPGDEEVWLIGERRATSERKYYASNLPPDTNLKALAAAVKARWICEQAHQQLKGELGLDHFEGRSWTGIHRHALMTMIAYAFLQSRRLTAAGRKKEPPDRPRNQQCQPSGKPSSTPSRDHHQNADLIVKGSSQNSQKKFCQSGASAPGAISSASSRGVDPVSSSSIVYDGNAGLLKSPRRTAWNNVFRIGLMKERPGKTT